MKAIAIIATNSKKTRSFYLTSPYLSPLTLKRESRHSLKAQFYHWLIFSLLFLLTFALSKAFLPQIKESLLKAYLATPLIYLALEFMGRSFGLLFTLMTKKNTVNMHLSPWNSKSLNEFWGKRWNTWVRDWIITLTKPLSKKSASFALLISFLISGLFHEAMVAVPYYILTGRSVFGFMMIYFFIQFFGMRIEKALGRKLSKRFKLFWVWFVVLAPIPYFINDSILYFLGIL